MAKKKSSKKILGLATATLAAAGTLFWFGSQTPTYHVSRVFDGDSFETKEGIIVRLAGVNAPEMDLCGGKDSKEQLEKLILDKPVYIKALYNDPFKRLVAKFTQKIHISMKKCPGQAMHSTKITKKVLKT